MYVVFLFDSSPVCACCQSFYYFLFHLSPLSQARALVGKSLEEQIRASSFRGSSRALSVVSTTARPPQNQSRRSSHSSAGSASSDSMRPLPVPRAGAAAVGATAAAAKTGASGRAAFSSAPIGAAAAAARYYECSRRRHVLRLLLWAQRARIGGLVYPSATSVVSYGSTTSAAAAAAAATAATAQVERVMRRRGCKSSGTASLHRGWRNSGS